MLKVNPLQYTRISNVFYTSVPPGDAKHLHIVSIGQEDCTPPYFYERPNGHNVEHMIYTVRGKATGFVSGREFPLAEGSLLITPKDKPYSYGVTPDSPGWTYRWLEFDGVWARTILNMTGLEGVYHVPGCAGIGPILDQLFRLLLEAGNESLHDALGLFISILAQAERQSHAGEEGRCRPAFLSTRDYMATHLSERFSLKQLAATAGLSRFHFSRAFKKATGVSPKEYLTSLRIARAQVLLREGTMSVKQVGHAIGYPIPQHFSKVFKQHIGVSPIAFCAPRGIAALGLGRDRQDDQKQS